MLYLKDPKGVSRNLKKKVLESINDINLKEYQKFGDPEVLTRINQYEMAYRMQSSVPELTDLSKEPKSTLGLYGANPGKPSFANNCLLARRLVERGVRFVQLYDRGWESHTHIEREHKRQCGAADRPITALIKDLKQRGLLEDTLVIWGGEFGRTPFAQGDMNNQKQHGRDHHPYCFSLWMAGGGIKGGTTYGQSDEFGYNVADNGVHVHDLQATILHLLGIDHERLTYKFQGREFRLTDVHGQVVKPILT